MDSHLFYLIVSDCIIYCLHQQKTYTTAIGKISNCLACRHKMERTVLFQLLSKLLEAFHLHIQEQYHVGIFPDIPRQSADMWVPAGKLLSSPSICTLYICCSIFTAFFLPYGALTNLSVFSPLPNTLRQNPEWLPVFAVRISASGNFSRQKCSISAIKICSTP